MKKSLLVVMAALAIAGCSQNDLVEGIDNGGKNGKTEIGFNSVVGKISRVADYGNTNLQTTGMNVYSFITDNETPAFTTPYIEGEAYTFATPDWKGTNKYYWPVDKFVHFIAVPTDLNSKYNNETQTLTGGAGTDLVVAYLTKQDATSNGGKAALKFNHILTRINFDCKLATDVTDSNLSLEVTSIKLTGVKGDKEATYDIPTSKWDLTGVDLVAEGYSYTPGDDASLMLLPQTFTTAPVVTIEYKIIQTINLKRTEIESGTKSADIPTTTAKWESGKNIKYTLSIPLSAQNMIITADVDNWNAETPGDTTTWK